MIEIYINNQVQGISENDSLETILSEMKLQPPYAVMLNQQHIVRRDYQTTKLKHGDHVDVVTPMQGG